MRLLLSVLAGTFACVAVWAPAASALPGDLDPTFGGDGTVITDFGGSEGAMDVALQADRKIVAVGFFSGDFTVARYNPDGSLDDGFDGDGLAETGFGAVEGALSVAIQPDGKIVAAGQTSAGPNPDNFALVRYNADGSVDNGFDGDGRVFTDIGGAERARGVAIQPNGRIITGGFSDLTGDNDFAFARYAADGSPDLSWDGVGSSLIDVSGGDDDSVNDVAIQTDGKIVFAGTAGDDFGLARYNAIDGSPDNEDEDGSFGGDGFVTTELGGFARGVAVAIQDDGRIVVGGMGSPNGIEQDAAIARYDPDGSLDPSFGGDGTVVNDFGAQEEVSTLAIQTDGKIVADAGSRFGVARYASDGTLDQGFGDGGRVETDLGGFQGLNALALQPDGKIVAAGSTNVGPNPSNFVIARYEGGEPPPPDGGDDGGGNGDGDGGDDDAPEPVFCRGENATIVATAGARTNGTALADVIVGTRGRDRIKAGKGRDLVCALGKKDRVNGGAGRDSADGGKGADLVRGAGGRDRLRGGAGNDKIAGGGARDILIGGKGKRDRCVARPGDRVRGC